MIKIGDKVKVAGTGGLYTTYQEMADMLGSKLYKLNLYPNKMLFDVDAMGVHNSRIIYLLKNEGGEFIFDAVDSTIEVITEPRTKTEFVKCEYNHAWEIIKLYEDGVELFKDDSDELQIDRINSIALRAQAGYPIYRKVETEIDERQEFIDRMLEMLDLNEAYDGNKIVSDMYDNFGFRFKLVE